MCILFEKAPAAGTVINTGIIMMIFSGSIIRLDGLCQGWDYAYLVAASIIQSLVRHHSTDINGSSTLWLEGFEFLKTLQSWCGNQPDRSKIHCRRDSSLWPELQRERVIEAWSFLMIMTMMSWPSFANLCRFVFTSDPTKTWFLGVKYYLVLDAPQARKNGVLEVKYYGNSCSGKVP